jgi:hypothetical protein
MIQNTSGYKDFYELELFFSTKETKLLFKMNPS